MQETKFRETESLIRRKIEEYRDWMIANRRNMHQNPEVGDQEFETTDRIEQLLQEMGMETERPLATGVLGLLDPGRADGRVVALRADIDALPIPEETDLPFKSKKPGLMHACGHDVHTAAVLCTAKILSDPEVRPLLTAPVRFIFQPAEETDGGAARLIAAGCLEHPMVDHVLGLHVAPEFPAGTIATKYGYTHATSDMFDIVIHGEKAHGAYPHHGVDAILVAAHIITAIQGITGRSIDTMEPCVITVGSLHSGEACNVVPDYAVMNGTMRTTAPQTRETAMKRMEEVVQGVATAFGATAELIWKPGYISLHNEDTVTATLIDTAKRLLGSDHVFLKPYPSMGVEDFSFYAAERPSTFFFLGTGFPDREKNYDIHHGLFEVDERALDTAVLMETMSVLRLMSGDLAHR